MMKRAVLASITIYAVVALLCAFQNAAAVSDKGVIYLDDLTFDKVVDGTRDVFLRLDKEYPWGDKHDAFKEVAAKVGESGAQLLVTGVPIAEREYDSVNPFLAARFGLKGVSDPDTAFPVFKLFKKGSIKPLDYKGSATSQDIISWLVEHTGVFIGQKGQIRELDALAKEVVAAAADKRAAVLAQAQEAADGLDATGPSKDYIEYYIKTMGRVVEKGPQYIASESARLKKMADDKGVAPAKKETFQWRLNVLQSFSGGSDKTEL